MRDYTQKEKAAIDVAYSKLEAMTESSRDASRMLDNALRFERRERRSTTIAKILIVRAVASPNLATAGLYGISEGIAQAHIVGAVLLSGQYIIPPQWTGVTYASWITDYAVPAMAALCQCSRDPRNHDATFERAIARIA
jgi:hypothetical protein